jgi:ATP synthase protein I
MPTKNNNTWQARRWKIWRELIEQVGDKEERKLKAQRTPEPESWFWLGMFGLVGWAVAIPSLVGLAIGIWIDTTWPSRFSWTLMLLFLGVGLGCLNAWYWITQESRHD